MDVITSKKYVCECGREFEKPNSFNAHKRHCKVHQVIKYGSLDHVHQVDSQIGQKSSAHAAEKRKIREEKKLLIWISEQHTCERCGKVMTEKFGSGRFCSWSCASRKQHSDETKQKIRASVKSYYSTEEGINKLNLARAKSIEAKKIKARQNTTVKEHIFSTCAYCGKQIDITNKVKSKAIRHYCNGTCRNIHLNKLKEIGGFSNFYVVSKWELELRELLTQYNINFEANKRDLLPCGLELDIWLPDFKVAIELNGIFHYSIKPYGGNQEALQKRQQKDLLKKQQCTELGYKLFVFEDRNIKNNKEFFTDFIENTLLKLK